MSAGHVGHAYPDSKVTLKGGVQVARELDTVSAATTIQSWARGHIARVNSVCLNGSGFGPARRDRPGHPKLESSRHHRNEVDRSHRLLEALFYGLSDGATELSAHVIKHDLCPLIDLKEEEMGALSKLLHCDDDTSPGYSFDEFVSLLMMSRPHPTGNTKGGTGLLINDGELSQLKALLKETPVFKSMHRYHWTIAVAMRISGRLDFEAGQVLPNDSAVGAWLGVAEPCILVVASGRCRLLAVSSNTPNVSNAWRAVRSPFSLGAPGAMHLELVEIDATGSVIGAKALMFAKVISYGSVDHIARVATTKVTGYAIRIDFLQALMSQSSKKQLSAVARQTDAQTQQLIRGAIGRATYER